MGEVDKVRFYTGGMCDAMALALHSLVPNSRLALVGFPDPEGPGGEGGFEAVHAVVLVARPVASRPCLLDVRGLSAWTPGGEARYLSLCGRSGRLSLERVGVEEVRHAFTMEGVTDEQVAQAVRDALDILPAPVLDEARRLAAGAKWKDGRDEDRWSLACPAMGTGDGWRPLSEVADEAAERLALDGFEDPEEEEEFDEWVREQGTLGLVKALYTRSDCFDFAAALERVTGWPQVRATFRGGFHMLNRSPDGRLVDVRGWADQHVSALPGLSLSEADEGDSDIGGPHGGHALALAVSAIRQLPWPPFSDPEFRALSHAPIAGVELPGPENQDDFPSPQP